MEEYMTKHNDMVMSAKKLSKQIQCPVCERVAFRVAPLVSRPGLTGALETMCEGTGDYAEVDERPNHFAAVLKLDKLHLKDNGDQGYALESMTDEDMQLESYSE